MFNNRFHTIVSFAAAEITEVVKTKEGWKAVPMWVDIAEDCLGVSTLEDRKQFEAGLLKEIGKIEQNQKKKADIRVALSIEEADQR
jgi:hypothetical protein